MDDTQHPGRTSKALRARAIPQILEILRERKTPESDIGSSYEKMGSSNTSELPPKMILSAQLVAYSTIPTGPILL